MKRLLLRFQPLGLFLGLLMASVVAYADAPSLPFDPKTAHVGLPTGHQPVWTLWLLRQGQSQPKRGTVILMRNPTELLAFDDSFLGLFPPITRAFLSHPTAGLYDLGPLNRGVPLSTFPALATGHYIDFGDGDPHRADIIRSILQMAKAYRNRLAQQAKDLLTQKDYIAASELFTALLQDSETAVVAKILLQNLSFADLSAIATDKNGRLFLDLLYYGLVTKVDDDALGIDGQFLKRTILAAKAQALHTPEAFAQRIRAGGLKIFPIKHQKMISLGRATPTLLRARLNWNGTVHVSYEERMDVAYFSSGGNNPRLAPIKTPTPCENAFYHEDTKTLPVDACTDKGIDLPEDEVIWVRLYDRQGEAVPTHPLELIQLSETLLKSPDKANLDMLWLTLTVGSLTLPGVGEAAAATVLPNLGSRMASVLLWTDRAALAVGALTLVANDQRGYIESRFGVRGQKFIYTLDVLNGAMLLYGGIRALHSTALWWDFKTAYTEVRPLLQSEAKLGTLLQRSDELMQEGEALLPKPPEPPPVPKAPVAIVPAPGSTITANVIKNTVANPAAQALVQQVEPKLRALLEQAVADVNAQSGAALLTSEEFGNEVHAVFYKLLKAEQLTGKLDRNLVWNRGKAFPEKGLPHSYHVSGKRNPLRPDVRLSLSLPGGEEAIWDPTTVGQAGKARTYASFPHTQYVADLLYKR